MTAGSTLYATDEDIALRASTDFAFLCPKDQKLAWGVDGSFASGSPWILISESVDFPSVGVKPGHVVQLSQPSTSLRGVVESFAVDSVTPGGVALRRKGQASGIGQPPAPINGISQVDFVILTFGPQIARASYELNRRYGIDDLIAGRRPCDLFDPREVRELTVLTVLYRQYLEMGRGAEGQGDTFTAKARLFKQELDDLLSRTIVHWRSASAGDGGGASATSRFNTRLSR